MCYVRCWELRDRRHRHVYRVSFRELCHWIWVRWLHRLHRWHVHDLGQQGLYPVFCRDVGHCQLQRQPTNSLPQHVWCRDVVGCWLDPVYSVHRWQLRVGKRPGRLLAVHGGDVFTCCGGCLFLLQRNCPTGWNVRPGGGQRLHTLPQSTCQFWVFVW